MSLHKLMEDLPSRGWPAEYQKLINEYREDYQKIVAITKQYYCDRAMLIGTEFNYMAVLYKLIQTGAAQVQGLLRVDVDSTCRALIYKDSNVDIITAFYIPINIDHFRLFFAGGKSLGPRFFWVGAGVGADGLTDDLEQILEESWNVPIDKCLLDWLLEISKNTETGFVHKQEPIIEIDGIKYQRMIVVQPMLPLRIIGNRELCIKTSQPCTVYVEATICSVEEHLPINQDYVLWIENDANPLKLLTFGRIFDIPCDDHPFLERRAMDFEPPPSLGTFRQARSACH